MTTVLLIPVAVVRQVPHTSPALLCSFQPPPTCLSPSYLCHFGYPEFCSGLALLPLPCHPKLTIAIFFLPLLAWDPVTGQGHSTGTWAIGPHLSKGKETVGHRWRGRQGESVDSSFLCHWARPGVDGIIQGGEKGWEGRSWSAGWLPNAHLRLHNCREAATAILSRIGHSNPLFNTVAALNGCCMNGC